jgi:hypothetical protein
VNGHPASDHEPEVQDHDELGGDLVEHGSRSLRRVRCPARILAARTCGAARQVIVD